LEVVNDFRVFLEGTGHLFPRHELGDLLSQLPEFFKVDVTVGQPIGTALVEKVQVFDEEGEEGNDNPLPLVFGSGRAPHGRFQRGPVAAEIR